MMNKLKKFWNSPITWGQSITAGCIGMGVSYAIYRAGMWMLTKEERAAAKKEKHIHRMDPNVKEEDFEN